MGPIARQHLCIVGEHPLLGAWQVADSVPMDWVEIKGEASCTWEVHLDLPRYSLFQYKYVVRTG